MNRSAARPTRRAQSLPACARPRTTGALLASLACLFGTALAPVAAQAQFDPARVTREPPAVAARFADPDVRYPTPAFLAGRTDFPSHAEVLAFLDDQARASANVHVETLGFSQEGRSIPMAVLAGGGSVDPKRPTVLILGQQHGNEPAGGEAALAIVAELAGPQSKLLERVNVIVIPRANPDGAERFARTTASRIDVNRDHLLLRTPEARAIATATARYRPQVILDLHEFTVAGRWVEKFGVMQQYDALLQTATVGNLDPGTARLAKDTYEAPVRRALVAQGLSTFAYHTTSPDKAVKTVAMGGVQPDTARNIGGLRPAVSLLIEVRGIGIGRAHLLRRVHTHVVAALEVVRTAAAQGPALVAQVRRAEAATAAAACKGRLVIEAGQSASTQSMVFVDAVSGADRKLQVDWRAATPLDVKRTRDRPCGYVVAASQTDTLDRLRQLGVRLQPVAQAARWNVERYAVVGQSGGQRQDARGAIDDGEGPALRRLDVRPQRIPYVVPPGSVYIGLDQPLGALIAAALEPDSQSSFVANGLLSVGSERLLRVRTRPDAAWLGR